jgi:N utilization substance protein B
MASNRHLGRIVAMQTLYEHDFRAGDETESELSPILQRNLDEFRSNIDDTNFVEDLVDGVHTSQTQIDGIIGPAAPEWPVEQIAKIDKVVLRIGVYFGGENSSKFINGVLGTIYRNSEFYEPEEEPSAKPTS